MIGTSDLNILFTSGLILILRPVLFCKIIKRFDPLPPLVFFKYIGCLYKIVSPPPLTGRFYGRPQQKNVQFLKFLFNSVYGCPKQTALV
jgi:hypothetical protein